MSCRVSRLIGIVLVACFVGGQSASGQGESLTPEQVLRLFFVEKDGDAFRDHVGEYHGVEFPTENTFGEMLPPEVAVTFRPLQADSTEEVIAATLSDGVHESNFYCYLDRVDGRWQLSAIRSLAMTGICQALVETSDTAGMSEIERQMYESCRLQLASDDSLKTYFVANIDSFRQIAQLAVEVNLHETIKFDHPVHVPQYALKGKRGTILEILKSLWLLYVERHASGEIVCMLGGILDNTVGYLYIPEGVPVPRMTRDGYIYLEPIENHWYLFKET